MQDETRHPMPDPDPSEPQPPSPEHAAQVEGPEPRLSRRAAWIAMGSVALALGLLWAASDLTDPHVDELSVIGEEAAVGQPAPLHFTIKDINGVDVRLASFKGKVVLLNFWATWCGPCKVEIPDLVELQNEYADDLVVLGFLSLDPVTDSTRQFVTEYGMNYPVLDGNGREDVEEAFGPMIGLPTSVIIGRDGRIAAKYAGIRSKAQLEREIKALL